MRGEISKTLVDIYSHPNPPLKGEGVKALSLRLQKANTLLCGKMKYVSLHFSML